MYCWLPLGTSKCILVPYGYRLDTRITYSTHLAWFFILYSSILGITLLRRILSIYILYFVKITLKNVIVLPTYLVPILKLTTIPIRRSPYLYAPTLFIFLFMCYLPTTWKQNISSFTWSSILTWGVVPMMYESNLPFPLSLSSCLLFLYCNIFWPFLFGKITLFTYNKPQQNIFSSFKN